MTGYKTSESHMDQTTSLLEHILLVVSPNAYFLSYFLKRIPLLCNYLALREDNTIPSSLTKHGNFITLASDWFRGVHMT